MPRVLTVLVPGVLTVLVPGVLAMLHVSAAAQAPARDGVITGQVVDAGTGGPVGAALVSVLPSAGGPNPPPRILTGADGRFAFNGLEMPGRFTLNVWKSGYADGAYGMFRPSGSPQTLELTPAQRSADVVIRVWKYGAITGTATDEAGEPIVGMQVRALLRRAGAPRPFAGAVSSATTDDRGVYRLASLLPGDYLVLGSQPGMSAPLRVFADVARPGGRVGELAGLVAGQSIRGLRVGNAFYGTGGGATPPPPAGTRMQIYPPTFHPGATAPAQATVVTVGSGEERSAIDLHLAPVTTLRVSGTVIGPSGPAGMVPLTLVPAGADMIQPEALGAAGVTDSSGAFVFPAVVPGSYVLKNSGRESLNLGWIAMPITVAGDDVDGVVATTRPPLKITARVQFDGTGTPPPAQTGRVLPFGLETEDGGSSVSFTAPGATADTITIGGYSPGRYRIRVANSPPGWMFRAALLDGVDVSITPFDFTRDIADVTLVFTDRWSGVGGVVQGARADRAVVILFPADARSWINAGASPRRLRSARVDARGAFGIRSVPPGDYYVVAISDEHAGGWRDPAMLEALARIATQVTVTDGEHRTIDLQIKEVRQ